MNDELFPILTQISADVGHVKGTLDGIKDQLAAHITQDQIVQTKVFERLGIIETAHATTAGKVAAVKWMAATGGAGIGFAVRHFWRDLWPF